MILETPAQQDIVTECSVLIPGALTFLDDMGLMGTTTDEEFYDVSSCSMISASWLLYSSRL